MVFCGVKTCAWNETPTGKCNKSEIVIEPIKDKETEGICQCYSPKSNYCSDCLNEICIIRGSKSYCGSKITKIPRIYGNKNLGGVNNGIFKKMP